MTSSKSSSSASKNSTPSTPATPSKSKHPPPSTHKPSHPPSTSSNTAASKYRNKNPKTRAKTRKQHRASVTANVTSFPPFHLPPEWAAHCKNFAQQQQQQRAAGEGGKPSVKNSSGNVVFGPIPPPPNGSSREGPAPPNGSASSESSGGPTLSATFGNIDVLTLAQSDFLNWDGNGNGPGGAAGGGEKPAASAQHRNARDMLLNYAAAAAASGFSGAPGGEGGGKAGGKGGKASIQSCTEAEMKALMNMFVEIMGMSLDPPNGSGGGNGNGQNGGGGEAGKSAGGAKGNSKDGAGKAGNGASATVSFARESISRVNMAAAAAAVAASNNSNNNTNTNNQNTSNSNPNSSSNTNSTTSTSAFPVFSMMFGNQNNPKSTNSNSSTNQNNCNPANFTMPSGAAMLPPPPGGWPPGAAAAAAAAVAAATSGGLGAASLSVPLGLSYPHGFGPGSYGDAAEWLQDDLHGNFGPEDDDEDEEEDDEDEDGSEVNTDLDKATDEHTEDETDEDSEALPALLYDPVDPHNKASLASKPPPQDRVHGMNTLRSQQRHINAILSPVSDDSTPQSSASSNPKSNNGKVDQNQSYPQNHQHSDAAAAELLREEEEAAHKDDDDEEERARRALKKREKKNRKKEKAKREAAIKAAQAAQKRRDKAITSWRSRVVTACSGGELGKLDTLLAENPLRDGVGWSERYGQKFDKDILREAGARHVSPWEEVSQNMEWLLPSCIAKLGTGHKGNQPVGQGIDSNGNKARVKLGMFVMRMAFHVVFIPGRNGRAALHVASLAGDSSFVQLVVDYKTRYEQGEVNDDYKNDNDEHRPKRPNYSLNILCEDLGWSPLHFAVVGGWIDVAEKLLAGGCNVRACTEPTLTCRRSNGKGVTARELVEMIRGEKYVTSLECNGDGLHDVIESRCNGGAEDRKKYKAALDHLVGRLSDVEKHGYTAVDQPDNHTYNNQTEESTKINHNKSVAEVTKSTTFSNIVSNTNHDTNMKTKKKKKKKKKSQPVESKIEPKVTTPVKPQVEEVDPLVTALLAMGFTDEQIHAALDACGGTERATADDLVSWILENGSGESSSDRQTAVDIKPADDNTSNRSKNANTQNPLSSRSNPSEYQQRRVSQAQKEAFEIAKRDADAKATAERLAAKREEQRRIRLEWNNREQQRQKEEAKIRLVEEVERSRRMEIERSKAQAQRIAKQRAAMLQHPNPGVAQAHMSALDGTIPAVGGNNVGSTPLFASTLYPGGASAPGLSHHVESFQASDVHTNTMGTQIPPYQHQIMGMNTTYAVPSALDVEGVVDPPGSSFGPSNYVDTATTSIENVDLGVQATSKQSPQPEIDVNGFDFPELGKDKATPATTPRTTRSTSNDVYLANEEGIVTSEVKQKINRVKPKKKSSPLGKMVNESAVSSNVPYSQNDPNFDTNPLGEIRATAREFVPTSFTPGSINGDSDAGNFAASMSSQPVPPGISAVPIGAKSDAEGSTLKPMVMLPPEPVTKPNTLLQHSSSPFPLNTTSAFDRASSPYPNPSSILDKPINTNSAAHSPVASTTSSITGFSASIGEDNFVSSSRVGSTMTYENNIVEGSEPTSSFLDSSLLGGTHSLPLSGSGLNSDTTAQASVAGSSIWGVGGVSGSGNFGAFTSLNFGDKSLSGAGGFQSSIGNTAFGNDKKDGTSSDTWGSSVPPNIGKSIW